MKHRAVSHSKPFSFMISAILALSVSFPSLAFADVNIDGTAVSEGENAIGGGVVTRVDQAIDMNNVTATNVTTDEDVTFNFNGGNEIDNVVATGSANVTANFQGDNAVEDFKPADDVSLVINANGCNEFDEVEASGNARVTINVTGENSFETIKGKDNASIAVQGAECQHKAIVNVGEEDDEDDRTRVITEVGDLTIDHVTMNLVGKDPMVGSALGDVRIDTSKVSYDGSGSVSIDATAGSLQVTESVIDVPGSMHAGGLMTIDHSDVSVSNDDSSHPAVFSHTGIKLSREENGEVKEGDFDGKRAWYVDTGEGRGKVDLEADGQPAYYRCADSTKAMPKTGDGLLATSLFVIAMASLAALLASMRRPDWAKRRGETL